MKVCLLLHGHVRTFEKTYQSLPKNIDNFDKIDIFIHTWDTIDRLTNSYYSSSLDKTKNININLIKEIYKPKGICIETQLLNNNQQTCPYNKISLVGHKYYFESFFKVNEMKKKI